MPVSKIIGDAIRIHEICDAREREKRVYELLDLMRLQREYINRFPHEFSGGERQRIAIARAILMKPPIFILDDALSSVDIQTEERILEGLEKFLQGKTTILITHRIAPLRRADRIIVLDEGRVAEMGDHNTLLSKGGVDLDPVIMDAIEISCREGGIL
jgi:ABC-type multidrug transport system fused ATPase/permease subunit